MCKNRACSLKVEQSAHNGHVAGSNPTWPIHLFSLLIFLLLKYNNSIEI